MGAIFYPNCPRCGKLGVGEYKSWGTGAYEVFTCLHCGFGFDWETRLDEEKSTPENPIYTETMKIKKSNFKLVLLR
jgi:transcription elongation factor Elf1